MISVMYGERKADAFNPKKSISAVKHEGGSITLWRCFAGKGNGALQKTHHKEWGLCWNSTAKDGDISQKVNTCFATGFSSRTVMWSIPTNENERMSVGITKPWCEHAQKNKKKPKQTPVPKNGNNIVRKFWPERSIQVQVNKWHQILTEPVWTFEPQKPDSSK